MPSAAVSLLMPSAYLLSTRSSWASYRGFKSWALVRSFASLVICLAWTAISFGASGGQAREPRASCPLHVYFVAVERGCNVTRFAAFEYVDASGQHAVIELGSPRERCPWKMAAP